MKTTYNNNNTRGTGLYPIVSGVLRRRLIRRVLDCTCEYYTEYMAYFGVDTVLRTSLHAVFPKLDTESGILNLISRFDGYTPVFIFIFIFIFFLNILRRMGKNKP